MVKNPKYAHIAWSVNDVLDKAEELELTLTRNEAEEFLIKNESDIQDIMIARGWELIENLLVTNKNKSEKVEAKS